MPSCYGGEAGEGGQRRTISGCVRIGTRSRSASYLIFLTITKIISGVRLTSYDELPWPRGMLWSGNNK